MFLACKCITAFDFHTSDLMSTRMLQWRKLRLTEVKDFVRVDRVYSRAKIRSQSLALSCGCISYDTVVLWRIQIMTGANIFRYHTLSERTYDDGWIEISWYPEDTFCERDIRKSMTKEWNGEITEDSRLREKSKAQGKGGGWVRTALVKDGKLRTTRHNHGSKIGESNP